MHMKRHPFFFMVLILSLFLAGCGGKKAATQSSDPGQKLVDEAVEVVRTQLDGEQQEELRQLIAKAKGVLIIPSMGNLSFLFSVGGGSAVLMARTDNGWSGPAFLSKTEAGFGFQAGVSSTSGLVVFSREEDVRYLFDTGALFQGNANIVFLDADLEGNRTPAFFETGKTVFVGNREGLYAGIAFNGGGLSNKTSLNAAYHGVEDGSPENILYKAASEPAGAQMLRGLLTEAEMAADKADLK